MTLPKKPQLPSKTSGHVKPDTSPSQRIDEMWEQMEERRMDKILETLRNHKPSTERTDSKPN